jgi:metal transporter CNNM
MAGKAGIAMARRPNITNGFASVRLAFIGLSRALFLSLSPVSALPLRTLDDHHHEDHLQDSSLAILYVASVILVLLGGAFAGLTIAYVFVPICSSKSIADYRPA